VIFLFGLKTDPYKNRTVQLWPLWPMILNSGANDVINRSNSDEQQRNCGP